jgi:putative FmdB family regulatory protein
MPFYEYQCKNCGHDLEAMQKINDAPLKKCPQCGKSQLQRLMSAPVFRLKGGGWYETDFKGDGDNKKNLADKPDPDSPKVEAKDTGKDAAKDGAAAGADATGKESKGKESDGKDVKASDGAKEPVKDKKPADKAATEPAKKPAAGGISNRGRSVPRSKSPAKKATKKAAVKRRR